MPMTVDMSDVPFIAELFAQAREEGVREGMVDMVFTSLRDRFGEGTVGDEVRVRLMGLDAVTLRAMFLAVPDASSVEHVLGS